MGRAPCCDKANVKKGPWSPEEDAKLKDFIEKFGTGGNWIALPQKAGLKRCGKSCRLRWLNYLRPNIRHGEFSDEEDRIICTLYASIGSRWSIIAGQLPGRTDNDIKNYWNTKLKKKLMALSNSNNFITQPISGTNYGALQPHFSQQQMYYSSDHNNSYYNSSFHFQTPTKYSLSPIDDAAQLSNINFAPSNSDNFSFSTSQYPDPYFPLNPSMLVFGGGGSNNEPSCTSSSDGSCSYMDRHHHVIKQEDPTMVHNDFQGFLSSEKSMIDYGKTGAVFVDNDLKTGNGNCDPHVLEEVKKLIACAVDDEKESHGKGLYYYYS